MTQRSRGRSFFRRGSRPSMLWFNNGLDMQNLAASTSATVPLLTAGVIPDSFIHGMTILRLILKVTFGQDNVANIINALCAFYVGTRGSAGTAPNLNADLANYYYFSGLQLPNRPSGSTQFGSVQADIRTKRIIRGEDTDFFFRLTNNEATIMKIGMECRMLLQLR